MHKHTPLISEVDLQNRVREIGQRINEDYSSEMLDIVCVLKGAIFFVADLMRHLTVPVRLHFMQVSSYGANTENSGTLNLHFSSVLQFEGKNILLVEDILDTGITLDYLMKHLKEKGPRSIKTCVLLDKPYRRRVDVTPDYYGFEIPDHFVIGYGLDYNELGRNLRYIAVLDPADTNNSCNLLY